jgi:hypothetical protein
VVALGQVVELADSGAEEPQRDDRLTAMDAPLVHAGTSIRVEDSSVITILVPVIGFGPQHVGGSIPL